MGRYGAAVGVFGLLRVLFQAGKSKARRITLVFCEKARRWLIQGHEKVYKLVCLTSCLGAYLQALPKLLQHYLSKTDYSPSGLFHTVLVPAGKVPFRALMVALVVNIKRLVKILAAKELPGRLRFGRRLEWIGASA
ncbi:MAG: hypothetical protein N2512_09910 [Armatimonadetes bacterium]|nr:hypothetical protein [Armatimonadota bacterium]